jgi:hypothetical protein
VRVGDAVADQWQGDRGLEQPDVSGPERDKVGDVHQHEYKCGGDQGQLEVEGAHRCPDSEQLTQPAGSLERARDDRCPGTPQNAESLAKQENDAAQTPEPLQPESFMLAREQNPAGQKHAAYADDDKQARERPAGHRRGHQHALVGRGYGFRVLSLRLLRPRQLAPLLVVETSRDRTAFVNDVPAIMSLLDPTSSAGQQTALTFEGFFLETLDAKGPFVRVEDVYRGEVEGGQWSWNRCVYPYDHSEPIDAKPCP